MCYTLIVDKSFDTNMKGVRKMKDSISTKRVSKYITEVTVGDTTLRLTDNRGKSKNRAKISKEIKNVEKFYVFGGIFLFIGFFLAVGTVGHSDMLVEMGIPDDMTTAQYAVRYFISFVISGIGMFIVKRVESIVESLEVKYSEI